MYYSDMFWKNFPIDRQGQTWVVDFAHSGVLIEDFQSLVLDTRIRHPIPAAYRDKVPIGKSRNLKAIVRAWAGLQRHGLRRCEYCAACYIVNAHTHDLQVKRKPNQYVAL